MYALYDDEYDGVDLFFNDDDIINSTPIGCYVQKCLVTMRNNYSVFTDVKKPYYTTLFGHAIEYNKVMFDVRYPIKPTNEKLNNAKHARR